MNRQKIKSEAKEALVGNRLLFLLAMLLIGFAVGATAGLGILISPILAAGLFLMGKNLLHGEKLKFDDLIEYFNELRHALKLFLVSLLTGLIVLLGFILFIIPGIIFALRYSQALFIMSENKEMDILDALRKSREMMRGYKWDLFVFCLSFIGHILLGIITLGLWFFYAMPYIELSFMNYYLHLKNKV